MLFMGSFHGDGGNGHAGLLGHDGGHSGGDGNGHGHGEVHVSFFSPLYITSLMISMGATGIISLHGFHMEQRVSLAFAFVSSAILSYALSYGYISFFIKAQGTSTILDTSLVGLQAEVLSPISIENPGQVAFITPSGRQTRIAKTETKEEISRGTIVEIIKMVGDIAIVKQIKEG